MSDLIARGDRLVQSFEMTIVDKIAEGGMGEVYEAILHGASGFEKRIALKVVRSDFIKGADATETSAKELDFLTRLVNEAKLVSNLIHTHIVQIYLLGSITNVRTGVNGYIAMEYVNGVNLRSFIDRHLFDEKTIPVDIAVYIASRVARALEYAHTFKDKDGTPLGIVHRDVTPTNVLLSLEGVVKLSDFGIAKALHNDMIPGEYVVGKKRYMAPEQHKSGNVDFRADIFSLGLLLYEMLCEALPEKNAVPARPDALRGDVPAFIGDIVARALEPDPERRYAATAELAVDLERAIYGTGYGPTFVTLAEYLKNVFPTIETVAAPVRMDEKTAFYKPGR